MKVTVVLGNRSTELELTDADLEVLEHEFPGKDLEYKIQQLLKIGFILMRHHASVNQKGDS